MKTSKLILGTVIAILTSGAAQASTTLADLINGGGSITVGDETFSNFATIQSSNSGTPISYDYSAISVTGVSAGGKSGLEFSVSPNAPFSSSDNSGLGAYLNTFFDYKVTDNVHNIVSISLNASGSATAGANAGDYAYWAVGKAIGSSVSAVTTNADNGNYLLFASNDKTSTTGASSSISGQSSFYVGDNLTAGALGVNGTTSTASVNSFTQLYGDAAVIPEPGMLALLAAGMFGFGANNSKRRKTTKAAA